VRDAFAESTLWGFEVAAEENNRVLVDATSFYLRDVHQVTNTLQRSQQGNYRLDSTRSAFYLPNTKNFPLNTEVETTLTFTGEPTGQVVRKVVPAPERSRSASGIRSCNCPVQVSSPACLIRAPVTPALTIWILRRQSKSRSRNASYLDIVCKRKIRMRQLVNRYSQLSITLIEEHRNRFV